MNHPRILIAGIGNIFLGDDAFGVEVAQRLAKRPLPDGVRVIDFGIRGLDLAYALLDPYEAVILVDATPRGGVPGTLYVIEPDVDDAIDPTEMAFEGHGLDPVKVLRLAAVMGERVRRVLLVGCEPATRDDEETMELSDPVRAAINEAVLIVESLAVRLLHGEPVADSVQLQ